MSLTFISVKVAPPAIAKSVVPVEAEVWLKAVDPEPRDLHRSRGSLVLGLLEATRPRPIPNRSGA